MAHKSLLTGADQLEGSRTMATENYGSRTTIGGLPTCRVLWEDPAAPVINACQNKGLLCLLWAGRAHYEVNQELLQAAFTASRRRQGRPIVADPQSPLANLWLSWCC